MSDQFVVFSKRYANLFSIAAKRCFRPHSTPVDRLRIPPDPLYWEDSHPNHTVPIFAPTEEREGPSLASSAVLSLLKGFGPRKPFHFENFQQVFQKSR